MNMAGSDTLAATVAQMQRDAIEAKTADLLASGYNADEISQEVHPDGEIRLVARRQYVASFRITVPNA